MEIKTYKKQGVSITKSACDNDGWRTIFWKYVVINLKTKKVLETYYLNH